MIYLKKMKLFPFLLCILAVFSCENSLDINPPSEFSNQVISTDDGINAVLNSAYSNFHWNGYNGSRFIQVGELPTDIMYNYRGSLNRTLSDIQNFTWDPQHDFFEVFWDKPYSAIRDANVVLDHLDGNKKLSLSEERATEIRGEAKFIRAVSYRFLYNWFGPVPLIKESYTSSDEDFFVPRTNNQEMLDFIESELLESIDILPLNKSSTGKATKGAALGLLTKFYLQTKQWTKAAESAKQVMDLGKYKLVPDLHDLYSFENKGNKEMIYVFPVTIEHGGNNMLRNALPPNYPTDCQIAATQTVMPVNFYNTYDPSDKRRNLILTKYTNTDGKQINLLEGDEYRNPRVIKWGIDPECTNVTNEDYIVLRYADILLSRAEALVMSSGSVSQEALNLLNRVHNRAGLSNLTTSDVPDKDAFIDTLLWERAWEFVREGKRREDLLRHDRFIQNAKDRGISNARKIHRRYAIPQSEIDANPNLEQNPGY